VEFSQESNPLYLGYVFGENAIVSGVLNYVKWENLLCSPLCERRFSNVEASYQLAIS